MNDKNDPQDWGLSRIKIEPELTSVKVMLADAEVLRRAKMAGEARRKAADLEEEKKRSVAGYKSRIDQATATAVQYEQHVQDGYYTELTECPANLVKSPDARHGWLVEIIHPTSGEVVSTRDPSPAELSMAREPRLPLSSPQGELALDGDGDDDEPDPDREAADDAIAAAGDFEEADGRLVGAIEADVRKGACTRARALERLVLAYGAGAGYRAIVDRASEATLVAHLELITGAHQQPQSVERLRSRLIAAAGLDEVPGVRAGAPAVEPAVDAAALLARVNAGEMTRAEAVEALDELHGGRAGLQAVVDAAGVPLLRTILELVSGESSSSAQPGRLRLLIKNAFTKG